MRPNFLGIGSVRGGSTWLHQVLKAHPDFFLPEQRKEIQYFTRFADRDLSWYEHFFKDQAAARTKWRGEITPGYLRGYEAPKRIASLQSVEKLILTLRNPIDRAWSHYRWHLRVSGEEIPFERFYNGAAVLRKLAIENGQYHRFIQAYLQYFERDQLLLLVFEELVQEPQQAFAALAEFFEVDPAGFQPQKAVNQSNLPRNRQLFSLAHQATKWFRRHNLDWIPNAVISAGAKKVLEKESDSDVNHMEMNARDRQFLQERFAPEVKALEEFMGRTLPWPDFHTP